MIVMREQLNVKQRQAISETPAKGGGGGLVETCFSSLDRMVAFPGKRPWLGCCLQGSVLIECYLNRDSADWLLNDLHILSIRFQNHWNDAGSGDLGIPEGKITGPRF